ncbi:MarR family transcriptional regulator [Streptomyces sp. PmtG]
MSDLRGLLDPVGHGLLARTLARCEADEVTGQVRAHGRPGGVFHLGRGRVVAVESPGAPGVEVLLLRSGRLSDREWADALAGGAPAGCPGAALVARGVVGAAELRVLRVLALRDAVFAVLAGRITACATAAAAGPGLASLGGSEGSEDPGAEPGADPGVGPGVEPARLLGEAARRLAALAALSTAVLPDRHRLAPASAAAARVDRLPAARREILFLADGRRTARDIAFVSGRGVYPVTVEASRMLADGLLVRARPGPAAVGLAVPGPGAPVLGRRAPGERAPAPTVDLPRRSPGASALMRPADPGG